MSISAVESYDNEKITLKFDNGLSEVYNTVFLRDACQSPESVDPYSKQKSFSTAQASRKLQVKVKPEIVFDEETKEPQLHVQWVQDGAEHKSTYPSSFLKKYTSNESLRRAKFFDSEQKYWDKRNIEAYKPKFVDYSSYMEGQAFADVVSELNTHGLCFVENVPDPELEVMNEDNSARWPVYDLASKFGYIKKTFYGTLFDVKNEKEAKNIANTATFLPLHMDLLYYESPPGLQLLHFIRNSTLGGDNVFADSFAAARRVMEEDPEAYDALKKVPINYHYDNANESYFFSRPLVVEKPGLEHPNGGPVLDHINYSPPFQGPFKLGMGPGDEKLVANFLRGMSLFEAAVNDAENQFQIKTPQGTCVIFDNRRVLHSRLEFSDSNGGDRWLMGCYVDGDSYRSKLRMLK